MNALTDILLVVGGTILVAVGVDLAVAWRWLARRWR